LQVVAQHLDKIAAHLNATNGSEGPVGIAKQTLKDKNKNTVPGLVLQGDRATGIADPINQDDAVNLKTLQDYTTCAYLAKQLAQCTEIDDAGTAAKVKPACQAPTLFTIGSRGLNVAGCSDVQAQDGRVYFLGVDNNGSSASQHEHLFVYVDTGSGFFQEQVVVPPQYGHSTALQGRYLYVSNNRFGTVPANPKLQIYDITDPQVGPVLKSNFDPGTGGITEAIAVQGHYCYMLIDIGGGNGRLVTVDVSNPAAPAVTDNKLVGPPGGLTIVGPVLVVGLSSGGAGQYHLSNPAVPAGFGGSGLITNCADIGDNNIVVVAVGHAGGGQTPITSTIEVGGPTAEPSSGDIIGGSLVFVSNVPPPSYFWVRVRSDEFYIGTTTGLLQYTLQLSGGLGFTAAIALQGTYTSTGQMTAKGAVEGRRLYTIDSQTPGNGTDTLLAFRTGGFFCESIETSNIFAGRSVSTHEVRARNMSAIGSVVAAEGFFATGGGMHVAGPIRGFSLAINDEDIIDIIRKVIKEERLSTRLWRKLCRILKSQS
jgi:hypothetical protein